MRFNVAMLTRTAHEVPSYIPQRQEGDITDEAGRANQENIQSEEVGTIAERYIHPVQGDESGIPALREAGWS
jgi:hypothetical protein